MQIEVKFDCSLNFPPITDLLVYPSESEYPNGSLLNNDQQTKMTGIICPLIKLNNTTINWGSVTSMVLTDDIYPTISLEINDDLGLQKMYDKPGADNILQIQILPPFDDAYKKINLIFSITSIKFYDGNIKLKGEYYVPGINNTVMKSFGYSSTYEFFENIAKYLQLGFCSNLSSTEDKRWIYIPNKTIIDSLESEVNMGGDKYQLLDYWIDYWNNINLVDIYDRYNTIEEDLKVWVQSVKVPEVDVISENPPILMDASITNNPAIKMNPLFTQEYELVSNFSENKESGTDKVIEVYNMNTLDTDSLLVIDGNIKKNIVIKYNYLGEEFGDTNYLLNKTMRSSYLQKLNSQQIKVTLNTPCLGFIRGGKVNFYWYENNDFVRNTMLEDEETESNIPLPEDEGKEEIDSFLINKELSGQYYISKCNFKYNNDGNTPIWEQQLLLSRKVDNIEKLVEYDDEYLNNSSFGGSQPELLATQTDPELSKPSPETESLNSILEQSEQLEK